MIKIECDAILFDLDGVLIDSTVCILRHWEQWAQQHHVDIDSIMRIAHGRRTIETIQLVAPHLDAEEETRHFAAVEAVDTQGVITLAGASHLLSSLSMNTWAIATSGSRDVATARLKHAGLLIPDIMVTADDVTRGKPDPEPYLAAARKLGISPERCIVIEDSPAGIEAACCAGIPTVAVATTHPHHELNKARVIVKQLGDIHVESSSAYRLAVRIENGLIPAGA